ncbi:MAG: hypothetical protein RIC85_00705 [Gammaproteobacteria bacterium]
MITECSNCLGTYWWRWEEAFDKFGFNDGDGQVETGRVAAVLQAHGYTVERTWFSVHNEVIVSIKRDDRELIPETANVGYDSPRDYLTPEIIALLDAELPEDGTLEEDCL